MKRRSLALVPLALSIAMFSGSALAQQVKLSLGHGAAPGNPRHEASVKFAEVLKLVNARGAGVVGRQLEPLKVHVRQGVATYDPWTIPLGEFRLRTEGVVDLVRNSMDVVTYVPIEALSDKALSSLKSGTFAGQVLPGVADALREVPFRTKGPLGGAATNIDFEMVAKNAVKGIGKSS